MSCLVNEITSTEVGPRRNYKQLACYKQKNELNYFILYLILKT